MLNFRRTVASSIIYVPKIKNKMREDTMNGESKLNRKQLFPISHGSRSSGEPNECTREQV